MNETILRTIHAQILERIAEITIAPKPTYSVDGQEIKWTEYLKSLRETASWIEKTLNSQSPFEIVSRGEARWMEGGNETTNGSGVTQFAEGEPNN